MDHKKPDKNKADPCQIVFLLTSDLKKVKCNKKLLVSRSIFFKKLLVSIEEDDELIDKETDKESYQNLQTKVVVYLDYESTEIERIIKFLENDELSWNSSEEVDIDKLRIINERLEIQGLDEFLLRETSESGESCSDEASVNETTDDETSERSSKKEVTTISGSEDDQNAKDVEEEAVRSVIDQNSPLVHRIEHVLKNYRQMRNWKDIKSTKDILTSKERNTLIEIQRDIVEHSDNSQTKQYKVTFEGVNFESNCNDKRAATDDIILQVFKYIETKRNIPCVSAKIVDQKVLTGQPLVQSNVQIPLYSFFDRCRMILSQIKTFDNLAYAINSPNPLLTPQEIQQILMIIKNTYVSAVPNVLYPCFRVSVIFDKVEFFGNGRELREAKDNVVIAVVDYITKRQLGLHIPKSYPNGFPWQEKVKDYFKSILAQGISSETFPPPIVFQHLGIKFTFGSDDPAINNDPLMVKIRDLTERYALCKIFNKALDIDCPDPNEGVS